MLSQITTIKREKIISRVTKEVVKELSLYNNIFEYSKFNAKKEKSIQAKYNRRNCKVRAQYNQAITTFKQQNRITILIKIFYKD